MCSWFFSNVNQAEDLGTDLVNRLTEWSAAHTDLLRYCALAIFVIHGILAAAVIMKREWIKKQLEEHDTVEKLFIIAFFVTIIEGISLSVIVLGFLGLQYTEATTMVLLLGAVVLFFLFILGALTCLITFLMLSVRLFILRNPVHPVGEGRVNWGGTPVLVVTVAFFIVSAVFGLFSEVGGMLAGTAVLIVLPVWLVLNPYDRSLEAMGFTTPVWKLFMFSLALIPILMGGSMLIYEITEKIIGQFPLDEIVETIVFENPVIMSIHLGVLGPVGEEIFFRGFAYTALKRKYGVRRGILYSSLFFGLYHGVPWQIPYAFVAGIVLAYVYEKTQSLYTPIVFHIINNSADIISIWA